MQGIDNDYFIFIYDSGIQHNIQVESRNSWGKKKDLQRERTLFH